MLAKIALAAAAVVTAPQAASAATIIIFTDPMSLDRRTMVFDTPGPDRLLLCPLPPAVSGCRTMPTRARR